MSKIKEPISVVSERLDDVPLLIGMMDQMHLSEIIDAHVHPHGHRKGLSFGRLAVGWLAYILSESNHKMSHVQEWSLDLLPTLSQLLKQEVSPTDFTDDRLADLLRTLSQDEVWFDIESHLSRKTIRTYDCMPETVRLDATTGAVYHDPQKHTLFQIGRHKTGEFCTVFKVMLGSIDPMGMPIAVDVVPGNCSDDPLYLPCYQRIRKTLDQPGLLYVGDCKMASLETRAHIVANEDHYLMPLPRSKDLQEQLDQWLQKVTTGEQTLQTIFTPENSEEFEKTEINLASCNTPQTLKDFLSKQHGVLAQGFVAELSLKFSIEEKEVEWTEQRFIARSPRYAYSEVKAFYKKIQETEIKLKALGQPGRGKKRHQDKDSLKAEVEKILEQTQLKNVFQITYQSHTQTRSIRSYNGSPQRTEETVHYQIDVQQRPDVIHTRAARMGWKVYASSAPEESMSLQQAIWRYREEYIVEHNFARLKGRMLAITPLYVQRGDHALGLIRFLTLALRILTTVEFVVRRQLKKEESSLNGIYAGNKKRATENPTSERMLAAFLKITLTTLFFSDGSQWKQMTPLNSTQLKILRLVGLSETIYTDLQKIDIPQKTGENHEILA